VKGEICSQWLWDGTGKIRSTVRRIARISRKRVVTKRQPEPAEYPNADIRVSEDFIREHEAAVMWLSNALARAIETGAAVDNDAREALEAQIKTYRTRESG